MGDFNATPFSRILGVLQDSANLTRLTNLPSWPSQLGLPQIAIDHIFVSPGITADRRPSRSASRQAPTTTRSRLRIAVPTGPSEGASRAKQKGRKTGPQHCD